MCVRACPLHWFARIRVSFWHSSFFSLLLCCRHFIFLIRNRSLLPSLLVLSNSCSNLLTRLLMSSSAAGSSAKTSTTSPTFILSSSRRTLKTGSGQYSPRQSNVRLGLTSFDKLRTLLIPFRIYHNIFILINCERLRFDCNLRL